MCQTMQSANKQPKSQQTHFSLRCFSLQSCFFSGSYSAHACWYQQGYTPNAPNHHGICLCWCVQWEWNKSINKIGSLRMTKKSIFKIPLDNRTKDPCSDRNGNLRFDVHLSKADGYKLSVGNVPFPLCKADVTAAVRDHIFPSVCFKTKEKAMNILI